MNNLEFERGTQNGVITLLSSDPKINESAEDYELSMSLEGVEGWDSLISFLQRNNYSSSTFLFISNNMKASFNFNLTLTREYKTIPRPNFPPNYQILKLDPIRFHAPIHLLSLFLQTLEPPMVQLRDANRFSCSVLSYYSERLVCEFIPDFEELAFNLACCPDDSCVSASDASIELHDTVHLKDMLDNEHSCPAVMSDFGLCWRAIRA